MTVAPSSPDPSLRQINKFDWGLVKRFVAIAQPYWFPTGRGGWRFFPLVGLFIVFLFSLLASIVCGVAALCQAYFPEFMEQTAGGLVSLSQTIFSTPVVFLLVAGFIVPAIAFFAVRDQVLPRWQQWVFLGGLLFLSLCVSGMNVIISFVGNFFTTALAEQDAPTFWRFFGVYAGVFAIATPFVVYYQYSQALLGLRWRDWMTGKFLGQYFQDRAYYDINSGGTIDNPDQRISQDINSFTTFSLSFLLILLGSFIDVLSFTGILISKSQFLAGFLIFYALGGTVVVALLGRRLISLNFLQLKKEADFRYGLVHVRDNAESIAFYQGEDRELGQLRRRFVEVLRNFNFLIGWQRHLGFFRTPYRYLTFILPSALLAPLLFDGQIRYGDITQANFAFSQIFDAFAIVVLQINQLSEFAAGVNRLETFSEVLDGTADTVDPPSTINTIENGRIALSDVTLLTPKTGRTLVQDLTVSLQAGEGLVIVGHSGAGKSSILRAIAGLWNSGDGTITRPGLDQMLFLPQRPYMVLGSLRDQLLYPNSSASVDEESLRYVLRKVNLEDLPDRLGGFDIELDWATVLSLGEQQRLAFARLVLNKPRYAVLDEATSALDLANERRLYDQLRQGSTTFISVGHRPSLLGYHDYVLQLTGDSEWNLTRREDYKVDEGAFA
ncbi:MAG: ABC transporter ATP-binding protein/permease [Kaiparowitsia implicata GSE-PSE-MK54-09C]|jgi:putative ATP-binding cassette transporter|nr:ABC transporter ATP-binding protein/permease [Kaiparowitsia implicata GSE-PSE-MK54-09C]